ncbi:MAG: response regulator [Lentisphaerae bacterium]|nr:MAG: response regulator [Lentisphaerota bacterium]
MSEDYNNRILIVDDNESIHEDFEKTLPVEQTQVDDSSGFNRLVSEVLGPVEMVSQVAGKEPVYQLAHAYQGEEAYNMVRMAENAGIPFAVIFMDVRMPPGWDGIYTIKKIWAEFKNPEIVICTAYSDYSWEEILAEIGTTDQLQFLRKPFDVVSIKQMALALTKKWNLAEKSRRYTAELEAAVQARTRELQEKIDELQKAMDEIMHLRGILPMCAWCHKIRTDEDYWLQVDEYISSHSLAEVSHGICPDCYEKLMNEVEHEEGGDNVPHPHPHVFKSDAIAQTSPLNKKKKQSVQISETGDQAVSGGIDLRALREQVKKIQEKTHPPKNDDGTP